uniref:C-type lectin domain-containing protein n=1 Tax=Maylandia zebra TaxID=106582 RepID=A0A3P9CAU9_9CICH
NFLFILFEIVLLVVVPVYKQRKSPHFIDNKKKWREAQSYCRENHTDLASGAEQLKEAVSTFKSSHKPRSWIGLFRDTWRWSDGSNYSYRHWRDVGELPEELSETDSGTRKCAMTELNKEGKWKADDCNTRKPFFCYGDGEIYKDSFFTSGFCQFSY